MEIFISKFIGVMCVRGCYNCNTIFHQQDNHSCSGVAPFMRDVYQARRAGFIDFSQNFVHFR